MVNTKTNNYERDNQLNIHHKTNKSISITAYN